MSLSMFFIVKLSSLLSSFGQMSSKVSKSTMVKMFLWFLATFILLFKESYRLLRYRRFHFLVPFLIPLFDKSRYGGLYAWQFPTNFLVLRLLSFSMDYVDASMMEIDKTADDADKDVTIGLLDLANSEVSSETHRDCKYRKCEECLPICEYNLINFMSYILYAPLYIAGPIITFNAYVYFLKHPQKTEDVRFYAVRWLLCFMLMECLLHYFPFFSVLAAGMLDQLQPAEMAVFAYMLLKLMWLKFLLIWRFFRLWALVDGMLPPENMQRCMSNNHSLSDFWRGWHSSYNKWILKYIYLPLGGSDSRVFSVWLIFLFVALWHDLEAKLLIWGLLNSVFYVIETSATDASRTFYVKYNISVTIQKRLSAAGGALFILVLICVNMTGYAVGVSGTGDFIRKFFFTSEVALTLTLILILTLSILTLILILTLSLSLTLTLSLTLSILTLILILTLSILTLTLILTLSILTLILILTLSILTLILILTHSILTLTLILTHSILTLTLILTLSILTLTLILTLSILTLTLILH